MEYEKALKTLSMDQLHSAAAVNALVDMWKYYVICQEIERREKILNS